jgi:nucleoside-diphosphate-sugar epimerase
MSNSNSTRPYTMKTVAITGCNGSVGQRVVSYFLKQHCSVLGIDISPLASTLSKLLADEAGLGVQDDGPQKIFAFAKVDLRNWDDTLACLKAGISQQRENSEGKGGNQEHQDGQIDGIVHLGAFRDPTDYVVQTHNTNVVASYNVLRAAAELGITRVVQASSVNVFPLAYSLDANMKFEYFPLDENHPNNIDEPYGLSKVIAETQAASICARYPSLRVASLRLHWSVPSLDSAKSNPLESEDRSRKDLWGWVQEDESARAFWLSLTVDADGSEHDSQGTSEAKSNTKPVACGSGATGWRGHEAFNIAAPTTRCPHIGSELLRKQFFPDVPVREEVFKIEGRKGFFDCSKAKRLLGWVHEHEG